MERDGRRDLSGLEIDGYRLERRLSETSFTSVYAAEQLSIRRPVVLKILRPELARRPRAVETFLAIARRSASIDHGNVVSVLDVRAGESGAEGDRFVFYSMERVEGGSLIERVAREGRLSAMDAARLLLELARVLEISAERGLVHSALEPSHVLFAAGGRSKLLHVGAGDRTARRVQKAGVQEASIQESSVETRRPRGAGEQHNALAALSFCAPEQVAAGRADSLCDLYALGACVRFALVGRPPYQAGSFEELVATQRARELPSVAVATDEPLPPWLIAAVDSLVARRRSLRPVSAGALLDSLPAELVLKIAPDRARRAELVAVEAIAPSEPASAGSSAAAHDDAASAPRASRRHDERDWTRSPWLRLAGAGVLAAFAFALFLLTRGDPGAGTSPSASPGDETLAGVERGTIDRGESGVTRETADELRVDRGAASAEREPRSPLEARRDRMASFDEPGARDEALASRESPADRSRESSEDRSARSLPKTETEGETGTGTETNAAKRTAPTEIAPVEKRRYSADERRDAADAYARDVEPSVTARRWRLAWDRVVALAEKYPGYDPLERRREEIARGIEIELSRASSRLRQTAQSASAEELARERQALVERFPDHHGERIEALFEEIAALRSRAESDRRQLTAIAAELRRAFVDGQVAAAHQALRDAESRGDLRLGSELRAHVERAERGRLALAAGWSQAIDRPQLEVRSRESEWRGTGGEWSIASATGDSLAALVVTLKPARGSPNASETREVELLELTDESLLEIARLGRGEAIPERELEQEVGAYLVFVRGAARGRALLLGRSEAEAASEVTRGQDASAAGSGESAVTEEVAVRITRDPDRDWIEPLAAEQLAAGIDLASAALDSLEREDAKATSWTELARGLAPFVLDHARDEGFEAQRERTESIYRRAREEGIVRAGIEARFRGKAKLGSSGLLGVTWEFDSPAELEDFRIVGGDASIEDGALVLSGEIRLARGDLLEEQAELSAAFTDYDARVPNLNLALWTRDDDRLRPERKERLVRNESLPEIAGSYLVFGVGYSPPAGAVRDPDSSTNHYPDRMVLAGSNHVPLPVFAVVVADRTRALDTSVECVWAESTLHRVRGPQTIRLAVRPDSFRWHANREALHQRPGRLRNSVAARVTRHAAIGSVTLVSFDSTVRLTSLRLEARLREEWLATEAKRIATEELALLAPPSKPGTNGK